MCDDRKKSKCPWASIMSPTQENIHMMASIIFLLLYSLKKEGKVPEEGKTEGWKEKQDTSRHGTT
jgi:hypothetical protein